MPALQQLLEPRVIYYAPMYASLVPIHHLICNPSNLLNQESGSFCSISPSSLFLIPEIKACTHLFFMGGRAVIFEAEGKKADKSNLKMRKLS